MDNDRGELRIFRGLPNTQVAKAHKAVMRLVGLLSLAADILNALTCSAQIIVE